MRVCEERRERRACSSVREGQVSVAVVSSLRSKRRVYVGKNNVKGECHSATAACNERCHASTPPGSRPPPDSAPEFCWWRAGAELTSRVMYSSAVLVLRRRASEQGECAWSDSPRDHGHYKLLP